MSYPPRGQPGPSSWPTSPPPWGGYADPIGDLRERMARSEVSTSDHRQWLESLEEHRRETAEEMAVLRRIPESIDRLAEYMDSKLAPIPGQIAEIRAHISAQKERREEKEAEKKAAREAMKERIQYALAGLILLAGLLGKSTLVDQLKTFGRAIGMQIP